MREISPDSFRYIVVEILRPVRYGRLSVKQRNFFEGRTMPTESKLDASLMEHRKKLWIEGGLADVRPGAYISSCRRIEVREKYDPDTFDLICRDEESNIYDDKVGWARGLANNVHLKIGDAHVLLMDNHIFAAAFIIAMLKAGVIGMGSSMSHIDDHSDAFAEKFDLQKYSGLINDTERLDYLLKRIDEGSWQYRPLIGSGLVRRARWDWFGIDYKTQQWFESDPVLGLKDMYDEKLLALPGIKGADICDIDIDVFLPLLPRLAPSDREGMRAGIIPNSFIPRLIDLASAAKGSKVVTIATSPAYIPQYQAILLAKQLVIYMSKMQS